MDTHELDGALAASLEDGRLSRAERQALGEILAQTPPPDASRLAQLRARAFALAKGRMTEPRAVEALEWVEDFVKLLARSERGESAAPARACFSPGDACLRTILSELERTKKTADICVFTITDDRIAQAMWVAHQRGVAIRVITDNDKQYDGGSDIDRLRRAGIPVKVDETEHHMHHKFAVLDGVTLLNGSYNWTRSACAFNEENLVVTTELKLVQTFARHFEGMWAALPGH
ncbi:MAG: Phosphatidylserine/phosphatidylglycerophosphate/cardiolipin synthase [Polyangiaceae bacterium]|nr:Phosphatidylserine/phosphatidylglycerophosphate/cardiolipin synthase [Polyangiaceae bacterium]